MLNTIHVHYRSLNTVKYCSCSLLFVKYLLSRHWRLLRKILFASGVDIPKIFRFTRQMDSKIIKTQSTIFAWMLYFQKYSSEVEPVSSRCAPKEPFSHKSRTVDVLLPLTPPHPPPTLQSRIPLGSVWPNSGWSTFPKWPIPRPPCPSWTSGSTYFWTRVTLWANL